MLRRKQVDTQPETINLEQARQLPLTREEFDQLCSEANKGNESAIQQLRQFMDDHPSVWQRMSDLALVVETTLIARLVGPDFAKQESLRRRVAAMKAELLGPDPPLALRLAAAPVMASWLEVEDILIRFGAMKSESREAQRFAASMIESAQRRHTSALREFAKVQDLLARLPLHKSSQRPRPPSDRLKSQAHARPTG